MNRLEIPLDKCNLKFRVDGAPNAEDGGIFAGYASVFGGVDSFSDTIIKGAFVDSLTDRDRMPLMLFGHDSQNVIGKWLTMEEDDNGLWVEGEFTPNHTLAADVYASTKHGAIDGMSIGFMIPEGGAEDLEDGGRRITKVDLMEVSIVGFPADDEARVSQVKSAIKAIGSIRDAEYFLRDAGNFSRAMAKALISQLRPLFQREADIERERTEALEADRKWLRNLIK